ncbi:hypothetical protein XM38_038940 [Halomicronema hongdechloris C2206]|uniref:Cyclic nucleotide-binding domain-containing protein n=1 Tax=Halomicronema hongdechloris C2206 TaxID=1641165 RepID=A0A1Z3HRI4_9CYAN|nr:cyclic nucleotide-binding domain-containing protein [Halomicronema hongdechloris]ASC72934.1 hypothetical protein XM38_038940 [Halomicronema hongdechloris C2206]
MLTSVHRLLFIRGVPIFKELRDDFLVRLASVMEEVSFGSHDTVIVEGQEGRALYILVSGRLSVHLKGQELAQLEPGACFGEMSVFDAEPRSASVTTLDPCDCLVLTQQQLYDAIEETPDIAVNIIRLLSRRIRELNQDLNQHKQAASPTPTSPSLDHQPLTTELSVASPLSWLSGQGEVTSKTGDFPYGRSLN